MKSPISTNSIKSGFIDILKGIFNENSSNGISSSNNKSEVDRINKNELDYFAYTYITDSP
jgi:hypothetical protein